MTQVPPQQTADPGQSNGLAVAGMVLGIIGLVTLCLYGLGAIPALIGLILSIKGKNRAKETGVGGGMAIAGLVTSIIALVFGVILIVVFAAAIAAVFGMGDQMQREMQRQMEQHQRNQQTLLLIKSYFA